MELLKLLFFHILCLVGMEWKLGSNKYARISEIKIISQNNGNEASILQKKFLRHSQNQNGNFVLKEP